MLTTEALASAIGFKKRIGLIRRDANRCMWRAADSSRAAAENMRRSKGLNGRAVAKSAARYW